MAEKEAEKLHASWLLAFPEMKKHLKGIPDLRNPGMYMTTTWTGFFRGNSTLTQILNTEFQSTSGDGASLMLWALYRTGFKMVNFIHDEVIDEIELTSVEDVVSKLEAKENLMVATMNAVITDVRIKVESGLMTRWYKEAKPVHDEKGVPMVMTGFEMDGKKPKYTKLERLTKEK